MDKWIVYCTIAGTSLIMASVFTLTLVSIRNAQSDKERDFVTKVGLICVVATIVFLLFLFIIPIPYNQLLWIVYIPVIWMGILKANAIQKRIREEESQSEPLNPSQ